MVDRAPASIDRYQLFDAPVGGSQSLSEGALRRHNEVMSPDFGQMQAVAQGAIRSVSQASSRRTTASIVKLRNQMEQSQRMMAQNHQAVESRMEQNQRAMETRMEQMMNLLAHQPQGVAPLVQQPLAAIAAPVRDPSPPRPSILSPPILTSVSDYQQIRRRIPVDTIIMTSSHEELLNICKSCHVNRHSHLLWLCLIV